MSRLKIKDYAVHVRLGCTGSERLIPQKVFISIDLVFQDLPLACSSDQLEDTLCYEDLCSMIKKITVEKEFQTIEHLSQSVLKSVSGTLPSAVLKIILSIHKVNPPIEGLEGGVVFEQEWTR